MKVAILKEPAALQEPTLAPLQAMRIALHTIYARKGTLTTNAILATSLIPPPLPIGRGLHLLPLLLGSLISSIRLGRGTPFPLLLQDIQRPLFLPNI
jgi:hypothetical protein